MRGRDGRTYYDDMTNWASPNPFELTKIIDEDVTPSADLATGGSREEEYEDNEIASRKFEWNCTYRYKKASVGADAAYAKLLTAYTTGVPLAMYFLDGGIDLSTSKGWRAPILIDQMPQKRNLGDLVEVTVHGVGKLYDDSGTIRKAEAYTSPGITVTTTTTTTAGP